MKIDYNISLAIYLDIRICQDIGFKCILDNLLTDYSFGIFFTLSITLSATWIHIKADADATWLLITSINIGLMGM